MQVITLDERAFSKVAKELSDEVLHSGFSVDMLIGIQSGGAYLSRQMRPYFTKALYGEVLLQRDSTKQKKRFEVGALLKRLPYGITNILRNIEVLLFEYTKDSHYTPERESKVLIEPKVMEDLKGIKRLLLVDDAIDSGATMLAVKNRLEAINPSLNIKIATLTQTHKTSFIKADYRLYHRVLLRCMWAEDYHGA